ncbi:MAG: ATPase, T2SS/T4P/T4SS family [Angelakisella sp.]
MVSLDGVYKVEGAGTYLEALTTVQQEISKSFKDMNLDDMTVDDVFRYKKTIEMIVMTNNLRCNEATVLSELVDRLYNSMAKYDVLTKYLDPQVYMEMGIEEIYGRWDSIRIKCKQGKVLLPERFPSVQIAANIFSKIAQKFNGQVNEGVPLALGEFAPNIRASFSGCPVTPEKLGGEFNIRIVHGSKMTRELLIDSHTVSKDGLDFLELCIHHKVGICISGGTGSGKTGTMYYLLSQVTKDATYRVGTIEIESREFDLIKYDENGNSINDVFSWVTRSSDDPRQNITANALLQTILRFTPDIIGMGEMRDDEAAIACEAGATGHGMITTTHADSAAATPLRLFTLCKKSEGSYDDRTVFSQIEQAFPIIVHQRKEMDGRTRRIYEIAEFLGCMNGEPLVKNIFEFVVTDNLQDKHIALGSFKQVGAISEKLKQKLLRNGASNTEIAKYAKGGEQY